MIKINSGNNPVFALGCLLEGVKLLSHPALRKYLLIPLLINLVLYTTAFVLGYYSFSALIAHFIPDWLSWLSWILWPVFFISFGILGFFSFTLLANLIAAPYYSQLSAKTLEIISNTVPQKTELPLKTVVSGELHRLRYLMVRILPLLLLFIIPVVNLLAPVLWMLFSAWGIAMEFMAYPLEDKGIAFNGQKQFLQDNRLGVLSFGGVVGLGLTLPVINLLIGQAAVIGATVYVYRLGKAENE